jgi:hypothetical protein
MRSAAIAVMAALCFAAVCGAMPALADKDQHIAPPPLRDEIPPPQPSLKHVWTPGYWKWAGINYEWVDGSWVKGKKGKAWVPGTWEQVGSRWVWKRGEWKKIKSEKPKDSKKAKKQKK